MLQPHMMQCVLKWGALLQSLDQSVNGFGSHDLAGLSAPFVAPAQP